MTETGPTNYFGLPTNEQAGILQRLETLMGRQAPDPRKDIWLCQVLHVLFQLPCAKPMAFKGGTSLSKVYRAINRFSEDIDVTIDYTSLAPGVPELKSISSNNQRKKLSEKLKAALMEHVQDELEPAFKKALTEALPSQEINIRVSDDAEKLWVDYPSVVENTGGVEGIKPYMPSEILIEFGGRNTTLPQNRVLITPDISEHVPELELPGFQVPVLSPARTFWEKATLIHVECHRPNLRQNANRMSRHWYDLMQLADHEVGRQALQDTDLLRDVLLVKETFFRSGYSNYNQCDTGGIRLIPDESLLVALHQDYQVMVNKKMIYGDIPEFELIVDRLKSLEDEINTLNQTHRKEMN